MNVLNVCLVTGKLMGDVSLNITFDILVGVTAIKVNMVKEITTKTFNTNAMTVFSVSSTIDKVATRPAVETEYWIKSQNIYKKMHAAECK